MEPEAAPAAAARPHAQAPAAPGRTASAAPGSISVDSRPRGANIFIDGRNVGTTPAKLPDIPSGAHVVRLELPDYRVWSMTTTVTAGQEARVAGSLERIR
jgi:hypothetical protein